MSMVIETSDELFVCPHPQTHCLHVLSLVHPKVQILAIFSFQNGSLDVNYICIASGVQKDG